MRKTLYSATVVALAMTLSACGGSGNDDSTDIQTTPTASDATSICAGTSTTTQYDVLLNTTLGITPTSRTTLVYGSGTDNNQCISIASNTATQADAAGVQAVTTDAWDSAISFFDPVGTSKTGGLKFDQQLIVTCNNNDDTFAHVAVSNPTSTSTLATSSQIAALEGKTLVSYECSTSGSASTISSQTIAVSNGDVLVSDSNGTTTIPAADAPDLFTTTGYNLNGNTLNWYLYQLTVGSTTKQVLVHTNKRSGGTYNVDLFLTQ